MKRKISIVFFISFLVVFSFWKVGNYIDKLGLHKISTEQSEITPLTFVEKNKKNIKQETIDDLNHLKLTNIINDNNPPEELVKLKDEKNLLITEYISSISTILKVLENERQNELELFLKIQEDDNSYPQEIQQLLVSKAIFEDISNSLQELVPPHELVKIHKDLIANSLEVADSLHHMTRGKIFITESFTNALQYPEKLKDFYFSLYQLNDYLIDNDFNIEKEKRLSLYKNL